MSKSEERYRLTLEAAPDPIIDIRLTDGCLLEANRAFCDLFKCHKEKITGCSVFELNLLPVWKRKLSGEDRADSKTTGQL